MRLAAAITTAFLPVAAHGLSLEFPALATPVAEDVVAKDSYFLATEGFIEGPIGGIIAEGAVQTNSWRIAGASLTTLQILAPLREQLQAAGYEPLFECEAQSCGGFDFRFQIDVLPEPDMHVNLGDFRYLAAQKPGATPAEYAALVVSRSANAGFVQLTRVGAANAAQVSTSTKTPVPTIVPIVPGSIGEQLESRGHATLDDLYFKTGSSDLAEQDFASLQGLADYLGARPERRVVLVGHTDAEGALDRNIALSRRRATAVLERLVEYYSVGADQVTADGVGYLSPRASNLTEEGRTQNRRVEAILTSTE